MEMKEKWENVIVTGKVKKLVYMTTALANNSRKQRKSNSQVRSLFGKLTVHYICTYTTYRELRIIVNMAMAVHWKYEVLPFVFSTITLAMQQRLNGLKSRSDESRLQAAKDLQHYVSTELREASAEQYTSFMDELNHHIFEMVSSSDANEKKGGIMAIGRFLCSPILW